MPFVRHTLALLTLLTLGAAPALADDTDVAAKDSQPVWMQALDNDFYKISLDARARLELADREMLGASEALTVRTRLGIGSKPIFGLSAFAELENTAAINNQAYHNVRGPNSNALTPIGDPDNTELNQAWGQYANDDLWNLKAKGGRQRIVFDDARFIGNVVWRQNEQTYDAALGQTSFGLEGLTATYAYVWDVRRIFGRTGRNWDTDSHFVNVKYSKLPFGAAITGFAYFLDFQNDSAANSSNTVGFRVTGAQELDNDFKLLYAGSYAYQVDTGKNPANYKADYVAAELGLGYNPAGVLKIGYELLGSDNQGTSRFLTPLSTAHKFNGFADVFLNNGGGPGLQDLYVTVAPKFPLGVKGALTYHKFWTDDRNRNIGDEFDFVLKRGFGKHLMGLVKGGFFFGQNGGPPDIWRLTMDLGFKF